MAKNMFSVIGEDFLNVRTDFKSEINFLQLQMERNSEIKSK